MFYARKRANGGPRQTERPANSGSFKGRPLFFLLWGRQGKAEIVRGGKKYCMDGKERVIVELYKNCR